MHNYKLVLEYDGCDFCGWQMQPGLRTVQGEMEKALMELTGKRLKVICAGRTDSGVHAYGQCANFKSTITWGPNNIRKALNRILPEDIVIRSCEEVDLDFHARFCARARHYCYRIYNARSSIRRGFYWCNPDRINFAALRRMSGKLLGEHDFGSFCVKKSQQPSNLCVVTKSCWTKKDKEYTFGIISNRFLHGMVRSLVGTMIRIAARIQDEDEFEDLLINPERSKKVFTAPACGLYLVEILY